MANLALQGGGAHGAFTWGVLDRLLKEPRLEIEGISATSAGAVNAVVLAHGLTVGGREAAANVLAEFWQRVAQAAEWSGLQPSWLDRITRNLWARAFASLFLLRLYVARVFALSAQSIQLQPAEVAARRRRR